MPPRRRTLSVLALATVAAAATVSWAGLPPAASAAASPGIAVAETTAVPADGVFHLEGHGFGGGSGLSQWGAEGGAESGAGAAAILAHYYPTTTLNTVPAASIRVLLSGVAAGGVPIVSATGLTVTGADGAATSPPADTAHSRLRLVASGGNLVLQNSPDGTNWANEATVAAPASVSDYAGEIGVGENDGTVRTYRGTLTLSVSGTAVRTVNVLPLEDYLRGVVPRESPPSWQPAALQAQAVAARSYAAYLAGRVTSGSTYDICDTSACQSYGGATAETATTDAAVAATAGQELTVAGAPIAAEYGASNGGFTVSGGQAYLPAVADPWDGVDAGNTSHTWTAAVTAAQLQARYPTVGTLTALSVTRRDGNGDWGGRVLAVVLTGQNAAGAATSVTTTGADLVNAHAWPGAGDGLRSSWWHVVGQVSSVLPATAAPTTSGLAPVTPFRVVETGRLTSTATRVPVAGLHGVPVGASAVFVVASAGRLARAQRADLLVWPSGGNRSGALALARLSGGTTTSGSGLVQLGADGALEVASSTGTAGLELTVVGWAGTAAPTGVSTVAKTPVLTNVTASRGSHRIPGLTAPAGAVSAIVSVTASAVSKVGNLTVGGVPVQTLAGSPQSTTLLVAGGGSYLVTQPAHVRIQLLGWLSPAGARLTALRAVGRTGVSLAGRAGFVHVSGGAVPASARTVVALLTATSTRAGDATDYPHGASTGQQTASPAGRSVTSLVVVTLKDGLLVVKPPKGVTKVQLTVLGWSS